MKKSNFYILLISNLLIFIGVAISLFMLTNYNSNSLPYEPVYLLIAPLVSMVFSVLIIALFQIRLYADLKYRIFHTNPKLFKMVKNIGYVSLFNSFFPILLVILAASLTIDATSQDIYIMRLSLIIAGLVVSGFFGILTTTFFTYINYRISFDEERRKSISKQVDEYNEEVTEESKEEPYQHSDKYLDMDNNSKTDNE